MTDLQGKIALVTGSTGGIGAEIARVLHKAGAELILSGTRVEKLQELAKELGDRVQIMACNLSDTASIKDLAKQAGAVDILVNNAGITKDNLSMRMSEEDFMNVLQVNLLSAFTLSKGVVRGMMKKRAGRIINISSVVAARGNAGQANYVASKAGLEGMTRSFAQEFASRNITVNAIAPGFISTAMTEELSDDVKEQMHSFIPLGRFGEATDIANAVAFLASDGAGYITGHTLHVNGGMYMN